MTASRIAIVEEQRGNLRLAQEFWSRAESHAGLAQIGARDRDALKALIAELDRNARTDHRPPK